MQFISLECLDECIISVRHYQENGENHGNDSLPNDRCMKGVEQGVTSTSNVAVASTSDISTTDKFLSNMPGWQLQTNQTC